jgi:uncharacterized FlaG/YvyC family protein
MAAHEVAGIPDGMPPPPFAISGQTGNVHPERVYLNPAPLAEPQPTAFVPVPERAVEATDRSRLEASVRSTNEVMRAVNSRLDFDLYDGTGILVVRVVDRETNRVIKTMPPEKLLELRRKIAEAVGMILDETV